MSDSYAPERLGTGCPHCGRVLVPPYAYIRADGRVICKAKRQADRERWLVNKRAAGTLRREQAS